MNQIIINSREWLNELINGATFASGSGVAFPKMAALERVKVTTNFSVKTFVLASSANEFLFQTNGTSATLTMSLSNWATEGFKVGDSVKLVYAALSIDETVEAISGNVITISDSGIVAALGVVSGTYYDDLELRNITVPTSVQMKFGIVPNVADPFAPSLSPNPFGSWVDGQVQAYVGDGMVITTPKTLTKTFLANAEISESIDVTYESVTSDYIFEFTVEHIFRAPSYKVDYLTNFVNNTSPAAFVNPESMRYIAWYKFGTSSTDSNEYRIFNDNLLNGSYGWIDNNFTSGTGIYELESIEIQDPDSNVLAELEATVINSVAIKIKKTSGTFSAGSKGILYVMKLPAVDEITGTSLSATWEYNHIFDSVTNTDGSGAVDGDFIKQLIVDVNADTTILDVTFDIEYSAAQIAQIEAGDRYFIGVGVGSSESDRKVVWCQCSQHAKDSDISGLITINSFNLYSSEKRVGTGLKTNNVDTWNNRLHQAQVIFYLSKFASSSDCNIIGLDGQVVSRDSVSGESFILDTFRIPFKATNVPVAGTTYQVTNTSDYRDFDIKPDAYANNFTVTSQKPVVFDATQQWTVQWPLVVPWREWVLNTNVPGEFYDNAEPQNNLNYKTSNYSNIGNWDIYIRLLVTVKYQGIVTQYGLYSEPCPVRDFDVDPDVYNWSATTKLYDTDDVEIDYILLNKDTRIATTFSMATAGGLTPSRLVGELTIEEYQSQGRNCRLNSVQDWWFDMNILKPIDGEDYVKVTQDVPNNTITIECLIDHTLIDSSKAYTIMSHLQDTL
jgi:hypothetical protein